MGITKIWAIKDSLSRVVGYAENAEKTEFSDMQQVLHYAQNDEKVTSGPEKTMYVTTLHCRRDHAYEDMQYVKRHFNKTGGNLAYHCVQSFKTGEVSPELCHQLGVELARQMWGDRFQVLIATHFNTGTYHNHLVINSVSYKDGQKFNCDKRAFYRMREISDALCREHNLTVIEHPKGKTARSLYFAEKQGEPTRYNLMRQTIDECIGVSSDFDYFLKSLIRRGYVLDCAPNRKYPTIRAIGSKKPVRLYHLGEGYSVPEIQKRIHQLALKIRYPAYQADYHRYKALQRIPIRKQKMQGSFQNTKKITGFRALYLHYCYFLGLIPKKRKRAPLSPELREACRRTQQLSQQLILVHQAQLHTQADVEQFLDAIAQNIQQLQSQRTHCYNHLRRCNDEEKRAALLEERNQCTTALLPLYQQRKIALRILDARDAMRADLRAEQKLRQYLTHPVQQRTRERER